MPISYSWSEINNKKKHKMKKFELIRKIFDIAMANGESYSKADVISSDCTRDGFVNRVYIKKLKIDKPFGDHKINNVSITCVKEDFSDASDADVRIEFDMETPFRTILYANELNDETLGAILGIIG